MTGAELGLVVGGSGASIAAIGTLLYTTPGKAWRLLVTSLNERVTMLEQERVANRHELVEAESEVRRLRTIRSVLEDLLRRASVKIPTFPHDDCGGEVAPERRDPAIVVVDPSTDQGAPHADT